MEVRKLALEEHFKTRTLWETVFSEDTDRFLDYYYKYVTNHNEIYVIEKDNEIVSMLHMNPYNVQIRGNIFPNHYIVAVATKEEERKQGLMGQLLRKALQDRYNNEEPITYLMPAAEAIYTPYGFVTVAGQEHYQYHGEMDGRFFVSPNPDVSFIYAAEDDCELLSEFVNTQLTMKYRVFTRRDASYYMQLLQEQVCQNGGIVMVRRNGALVGCFLTANEGYQQVRELIFLKDELEALNLDLELKESPKIMIRVTHVEKLLPCMKFDKESKGIYHVIDPIIEGNTGIYRLSPSYGGMRCKKISSEVIVEDAITIEEVAKMVFGRQSILLNEIV